MLSFLHVLIKYIFRTSHNHKLTDGDERNLYLPSLAFLGRFLICNLCTLIIEEPNVNATKNCTSECKERWKRQKRQTILFQYSLSVPDSKCYKLPALQWPPISVAIFLDRYTPTQVCVISEEKVNSFNFFLLSQQFLTIIHYFHTLLPLHF